LATDEARETIIRRAESRVSPYYRSLSAEDQNEYINSHINADRDMMASQMQEISDDLEVVRTVMSTWNEPAAGADSSSRSVSTYSDEEGFDVGFINEYDVPRVPMSRTDENIERLIERPRLRRSSAVRPVDLIWPEDDADTLPYVPDSPIGPPPGYDSGSPDYDPGSPDYTPSPVYDPNSPMPGSPMPSTPTDPMPSYDGNMDDDSIGSTTRFFALLDGADSTESSNDPEIIDVDPTPPGSPVRTPPPGSPTVPSRPRRSRGRGGNKTKRKQKKGQTRKKVKRKSTKKRKGKSAKKTKKRK
jgi:hypothetical protein